MYFPKDLPHVEAQETVAINFAFFSHRARSNNLSLEPIEEIKEDVEPIGNQNDGDFDAIAEEVEESVTPISNRRNSGAPSRSASIGSKLSRKSVNFNVRSDIDCVEISYFLIIHSNYLLTCTILFVFQQEEVRGNITVTTVEMNGLPYEIHEGEFSFNPSYSDMDNGNTGRPRSRSIIQDDLPLTLLQPPSKSQTESSPPSSPTPSPPPSSQQSPPSSPSESPSESSPVLSSPISSSASSSPSSTPPSSPPPTKSLPESQLSSVATSLMESSPSTTSPLNQPLQEPKLSSPSASPVLDDESTSQSSAETPSLPQPLSVFISEGCSESPSESADSDSSSRPLLQQKTTLEESSDSYISI